MTIELRQAPPLCGYLSQKNKQAGQKKTNAWHVSLLRVTSAATKGPGPQNYEQTDLAPTFNVAFPPKLSSFRPLTESNLEKHTQQKTPWSH